MKPASTLLIGLCFAFAGRAAMPVAPTTSLLLAPEQLLRDDWRAHWAPDAVVVQLGTDTPDRTRRAAKKVQDAGLALYYWVEIARDQAMADRHPEWQASVQGPHREWRRLFPDAPEPGPNQVVKVYPWTPILNRAAFDAHLTRVRAVLDELPAARGIYLNNLQGGPSACGCGNPLCRWTSDYGPARTTEPASPDAAARFVRAVRAAVPQSEIIPVWVTECAEADAGRSNGCAGVNCYHGRCWPEWARQLDPLARDCSHIAVLGFCKSFGHEPDWLRDSIAAFQTEMRRSGHPAIEPARILVVLEAWDLTIAELDAQMALAKTAGVGGCIVSACKIEQSWQPKLVELADEPAANETGAKR